MLWGRFFMNRPHHCLLSSAVHPTFVSRQAIINCEKNFLLSVKICSQAGPIVVVIYILEFYNLLYFLIPRPLAAG